MVSFTLLRFWIIFEICECFSYLLIDNDMLLKMSTWVSSCNFAIICGHKLLNIGVVTYAMQNGVQFWRNWCFMVRNQFVFILVCGFQWQWWQCNQIVLHGDKIDNSMLFVVLHCVNEKIFKNLKFF